MTLADAMLVAAVLAIAAVPPVLWHVFGDGRRAAVTVATPPAEEPEVTQDDVDELIRRILEADAER